MAFFKEDVCMCNMRLGNSSRLKSSVCYGDYNLAANKLTRLGSI